VFRKGLRIDTEAITAADSLDHEDLSRSTRRKEEREAERRRYEESETLVSRSRR